MTVSDIRRPPIYLVWLWQTAETDVPNRVMACPLNWRKSTGPDLGGNCLHFFHKLFWSLGSGDYFLKSGNIDISYAAVDLAVQPVGKTLCSGIIGYCLKSDGVGIAFIHYAIDGGGAGKLFDHFILPLDRSEELQELHCKVRIFAGAGDTETVRGTGDDIHLGVVLTVNMMIGSVTPPFGMMVFIASGIAKEKVQSVFKEALPMCALMILVLMAITYIPGLITFIPNTLMG